MRNLFGKIYTDKAKVAGLVAAASGLGTFLGGGGASKQDARKQDDRVPVYLASNSIPYVPHVHKRKVQGISFRPGGLGLGVTPVFKHPDTKFKVKAWLGIREHFMTEKGVVDSEMERLVNEALWKHEKLEYVFLPRDVTEEFYKEAANGVAWPIHHDLNHHAIGVDKSVTYEQMNELIADKIIDKIKADNNGEVPDRSMVWVHDYHLQSSPKYLKTKAPQLKVGYVHHIPFPEVNKSLLDEIPQHEKHIRETIEGILHADSITFHTAGYKENFIKAVKYLGIIRDENELKRLEARILVNPIGISKKLISENLMQGLNEGAYDPLEHVPFPEDNLGITRDFEKGKVSEVDLAEEWNKEAKIACNVHRKKSMESNAPLELVPFAYESLNEHPLYEHTFDGIDFVSEWPPLPPLKTKGDLKMNPEKINIGAVSRLDYTKGIQELVDGYHLFLKQKVAQGVAHPEKLYQLNIVASAPRDIKAYIEYQKNVAKKMDDILEEFPGSLTFIPGVNFNKLPLNNAVQNIIASTSFKDGFLMAGVEALKARLDALKIKGLIKGSNRPTAFIISEGAGVVESLKRDENGEIDIPKELSIVSCSKEAVLEALNTQVSRIAIESRIPEEEQNLEGLDTLVDRVPTVEQSGKRALEALEASDHNAPLKLNLSSSKEIERPSSPIGFEGFLGFFAPSNVAKDSRGKVLERPREMVKKHSKRKGI